MPTGVGGRLVDSSEAVEGVIGYWCGRLFRSPGYAVATPCAPTLNSYGTDTDTDDEEYLDELAIGGPLGVMLLLLVAFIAASSSIDADVPASRLCTDGNR